jgi:hypothetical protein
VRKRVLPLVRWVAAEEGEVPQAFVAAFEEFAASARQELRAAYGVSGSDGQRSAVEAQGRAPFAALHDVPCDVPVVRAWARVPAPTFSKHGPEGTT